MATNVSNTCSPAFFLQIFPLPHMLDPKRKPFCIIHLSGCITHPVLRVLAEARMQALEAELATDFDALEDALDDDLIPSPSRGRQCAKDGGQDNKAHSLFAGVAASLGLNFVCHQPRGRGGSGIVVTDVACEGAAHRAGHTQTHSCSFVFHHINNFGN